MKALTIFCAVALSICWAAFASTVDTVTVHFANPVTVGETTLPAGNVSIQILRGSANVVLAFRSESGVTASAVANRINSFNEGPTDSSASVVLGREGDVFKVERLWLPDHTGFALLPLAQ
jgi:hypothetical protein